MRQEPGSPMGAAARERPAVVFLGDATHGEFRELVSWLGSRTHLTCLDDARDIEANLLAAAKLVVFAQPRPDTIKRGDVERLHQLAPLTPVVAVLGGWCEGETRTGRPWPGVTRVYWHEFRARLGAALETNETLTGVAPFPRSLTDAERLLSRTQQPVPQGEGMVAIHTKCSDAYTGLADAVRLAGYSSVWSSRHSTGGFQGVAVGIWDCVESVDVDAAALAAFSRKIAPAPVVALLHFPRGRDVDQAKQAGASRVLSKPFLIEDLLSELGSVTNTAPVNAAA